MKQLSAQDAQFLYMETERNLSNVVMGCVYAPPARMRSGCLFELLKSHVESRVHTSPIFRRKLVRVPLDLDFPYWADDEHFDLCGHLHSHRLTGQDRWQEFCDLMGRVYSRPLDMNRPLWEMHLVENLGGVRDFPEGSFGILTKLHHAAVDGAAMMRFFDCLSDRDAKGTPARDIKDDVETTGAAPTVDQIWRRFLINQIQSPLKLSRSLLRSAAVLAPAALESLADRREKQKNPVPITRFRRQIVPAKNFDAAEFPLQDFKLIQRTVEGAKINDVVLAVCSGALRLYLDRHDELPAESLMGWVPINTRDNDTAADGEAGNQVTAMITQLYTHLDDPIERLKQIARQTRIGKAGKSGVSIRVITEISGSMPGAALALTSRMLVKSGVAAGMCNLAISNVPGPQQPLYLRGARCLHQYGMTPLGDGMGLFIVALSYDGKLSLSLTSTMDIVPDMVFLRECLEASVAELGQAARHLSAPPEGLQASLKSKPRRRH